MADDTAPTTTDSAPTEPLDSHQLAADAENELKFLREQARKYTEKYTELLEKRIKELEEPRPNGRKKGSKKSKAGSGDERDESDESDRENRPDSDKVKNEKSEKPDKDGKPLQYKVVCWDHIGDGGWEHVPEEELEKTETEPKKKEKPSDSDSELAFTYRKTRNGAADFPDMVLGRRMCSLLRKFLPHFPDHDLDTEDPMFVTPFPMLIFNWSLLEREANKETEDAEEKQDLENLRALMKIVSTNSGDPKLDSYFRSRDANLKNGKITFDTIWTLFPPGEMVISRPFLDQDQIFIVQGSVRYGWPHAEANHRRKPPAWTIICWSYDWDGAYFDRKPFEFDIEPFSGTRSINSLVAYPVKFYSDPVDGATWDVKLKLALISRGKRFREICVSPRGSRMFDYFGLGLSRGRGISAQDTPGEESPFNQGSSVSGDYWDEYSTQHTRLPATKKSPVKGTIMIDFEAYYQHASTNAPLGALEPSIRETECGCSTCQKNDVLRRTLKFDYDQVEASVPLDSWEEDQLLICPPRVMAYSMRNSHWAQVHVEGVKTAVVDPNADTFDHKLSLNIDTKMLIKDLVVNHEKGKKRDGRGLDDLVEDKGKGLVLLFHGPPGVGKTLTAESVAKSTGKPLFSIGVSDIGVDSRTAEKNLRRFFNLATEWEAVMLIDEADVFLNSRGQGETNLEKNALVSVLLRVLEYYEGILILTTNRINSFDVAVQSRVHLAVKYHNFNDKQISEIYTIFLKQIRDDDNIANWDNILDWIKIESRTSKFNGRQIRNIVSAALGLARAESKKLNSDHLDQIVRRTTEFHEELAEQRKAYEMKQLARGYGER
ncbi:hypothetical protein V493_02921 [Pseudogymnoascus sp. VKM F-4281 (FW-2241)]|nr:hypothetical protein V493_02921 [Pseudogymnoascus sp. VKM F-4281 (FW-2241)]